MEETLDQISPILPIDCFQLTLPLHPFDAKKEGWRKKHRLPNLSGLLCESSFAEISMGYSARGLFFHIAVDKPFEDCSFPDYRKGDSVEIFVDTRDMKSAEVPTKFCHHFVFLAGQADGVQAREVTAFRTDDRRDLCDAEKLKVKTELKRRGYSLDLFIPADCLEGYAPDRFDRLGFTYRINRPDGEAQHFAISSDYLAIEKEAKRWSSMQL